MKKIVCFILFNLLFLFSSNIFALEIEYNTQYNIQKAVLVEDYISRNKDKINAFIKKYYILNNSSIQNNINELDESIIALRKIQNTDIEKQKAEDVLKAVMDRIKDVNENLKKQLEIEKNLFEKNLKTKRDAFSKLWLILAEKITYINTKTAKNIFKNNSSLSSKELKIKQNLVRLNIENQKLKNFWNVNFKSEKEIKDSFIRILQNIKREINSMKQTLN